MRGVVSAGMVVALEQLGLLAVFDDVYGSSAGAMNGAFFVAGQAAFGTSIYYENINNASFVSLRRLIGSRPILNLDFLVWNVMCGAKRLDVERVLSSRVPLHAIATDVSTGEGERFAHWDSRDDFLRCLRAGASMPGFSGPPYPYRGRHYWDALLSEPIPARTAEDDGCSHLVVLRTRPAGSSGPRLTPLDRLYVLPTLRQVSSRLAERYVERPVEYGRLLAALDRGQGPAGRAHVLTLAPSGPVVGKLERRREPLVASAHAGMRAVFDGLGYPVPDALALFFSDR